MACTDQAAHSGKTLPPRRHTGWHDLRAESPRSALPYTGSRGRPLRSTERQVVGASNCSLGSGVFPGSLKEARGVTEKSRALAPSGLQDTHSVA